MTARATPSILSKGFIWFMSCFQTRTVKIRPIRLIRGKKEKNLSVVKEEKAIRVRKGKYTGDGDFFCETFPVRGVMYLRNNC